LSIEPNYSPAIISLIIAHNILNDVPKAKTYLEILERYEPRNAAVRELKNMMGIKSPAAPKHDIPKSQHPSSTTRRKPKPKPVSIKLGDVDAEL